MQGERYVVLARLELREDDFDLTGVEFVQDFASQGRMVISGGHAAPDSSLNRSFSTMTSWRSK